MQKGSDISSSMLFIHKGMPNYSTATHEFNLVPDSPGEKSPFTPLAHVRDYYNGTAFSPADLNGTGCE